MRISASPQMEEMLLAAPFGPSKMSVCQCACEGGGWRVHLSQFLLYLLVCFSLLRERNDHLCLFLVNFTQSKYRTGEWVIPTLPVICIVRKMAYQMLSETFCRALSVSLFCLCSVQIQSAMFTYLKFT